MVQSNSGSKIFNSLYKETKSVELTKRNCSEGSIIISYVVIPKFVPNIEALLSYIAQFFELMVRSTFRF